MNIDLEIVGNPDDHVRDGMGRVDRSKLLDSLMDVLSQAIENRTMENALQSGRGQHGLDFAQKEEVIRTADLIVGRLDPPTASDLRIPFRAKSMGPQKARRADLIVAGARHFWF